MHTSFGDIDMNKLTKSEIRNKVVLEYKRIYSRKYRRAHYRNRWVRETDNHTAEEDFKNWAAESKIIMRKHKIGLISDEQMIKQLDEWFNQDVEMKQIIDELSITKK